MAFLLDDALLFQGAHDPGYCHIVNAEILGQFAVAEAGIQQQTSIGIRERLLIQQIAESDHGGVILIQRIVIQHISIVVHQFVEYQILHIRALKELVKLGLGDAVDGAAGLGGDHKKEMMMGEAELTLIIMMVLGEEGGEADAVGAVKVHVNEFIAVAAQCAEGRRALCQDVNGIRVVVNQTSADDISLFNLYLAPVGIEILETGHILKNILGHNFI